MGEGNGVGVGDGKDGDSTSSMSPWERHGGRKRMFASGTSMVVGKGKGRREKEGLRVRETKEETKEPTFSAGCSGSLVIENSKMHLPIHNL